MAELTLTPSRRIRQMVKRFTKTCRRCLIKLAGMTSATDQNSKSIPFGRKLANSGLFAENFRVHSAGNFLAKELA